MAKIEVEHRGLLTEEKFDELNRFFKKTGKFFGEKDRFSIIYSPRGKETIKLYRSPIDLRLRITNKLDIKKDLLITFKK